MRRREFITLVGAAVAWPAVARAQQPERLRRIGFLGLDTASSYAPRLNALRAGLRDHGYVEGKNIVIELRWAEGNYGRLPALADELVRLNVDVLVTHGSSGALAAKKATSSIPIVITAVGDMLSLGLVSSLSRPGGNITGLSLFASELTAKRLELLKEAIPSLTKAAILLNPDNAAYQFVLQETEAAATALNIELKAFDVRQPSDFEKTFSAMVDQQIGAVVIFEDTMLNANAKVIADLAITKRLPSSGFPEFARAGASSPTASTFPIWTTAQPPS
jgi:putative ABC transport system substrate-binding protein